MYPLPLSRSCTSIGPPSRCPNWSNGARRACRNIRSCATRDYGAYLREDVGGLQFGPYEFEKDSKLWAVDGVPKDFEYGPSPEDFEAVEAQWGRALERVPALGSVGIKANTRGHIRDDAR